MIDSKYSMKYKMPHSVVHIVDNTGQQKTNAVVKADDPSLYSTIVVTGLPMGEDNQVVNITRSDILNVAYGLSGISKNDRDKYGQTIEYPNALIEQGAPVKLLRVTPEGSTYAVAPIVIQWRTDIGDNKMHVRYKQVPIPMDMQISKFKSADKLNAALVSQFSNNSVVDADGTVWKQRSFINYIAAGRGAVYDNFACAINLTSQNKRPVNIKYEFVTIDTRISEVSERYTASLVNIDNANRVDVIETSNVVISQREQGSSIVRPFVNEAAVTQVYKEYRQLYKENMEQSSFVEEYIKQVYTSMNVNTFDILYGNYIYEGISSNMKLPYYQVDMLDSSIPTLAESYRIKSLKPFVKAHPSDLYKKLMPMTYGVSRTGDNCYVGNVYLSSTYSNGVNPVLTMVTSINQYSGSVTSVTVPKVFPLNSTGSFETKSVAIKTIFNDGNALGVGSKTLDLLVSQGKLVAGDVVARVNATSFDLFTVTDVTPAGATKYTLGTAYTQAEIRRCFDWGSHSSGEAGTGNVIGKNASDPAFVRVGATVIDSATGLVYVNDYGYTYDSAKPFADGRIAITSCTCTFGTCPSEVNITSDIINSSYDVLVYDRTAVTSWTVKSLKIVSGGEGYTVGDVLQVSINGTGSTLSNTDFKVVAVDANGAITELAIVYSETTIETVDLAGNTYTLYKASGTVTTNASVSFTDDDIAPASINGDPDEIVRYVVTGIQGSLYRAAADPTPIPANYYSNQYGLNLQSEFGGVRLNGGSAGFFDDEDISPIVYKWRYSALLVNAYRGKVDPRLQSPTRTPAKYLFDGSLNTVVGISVLPSMTYQPSEIIQASTVFTEEEKDQVVYDPSCIADITQFEDIDVKQAMYDFMIYRVYQGIPEAKRPVGPGSGLSLYLDSCDADAQTALLMNDSFTKRFTNANASWDIGGIIHNGEKETYTGHIAKTLIAHCKNTSINKPYAMSASRIESNEYNSYYPNIDATDWDLRDLMYNSGGNVWIPDVNNVLTRQSQRTLNRTSDSSDLIQESNMRTLSQFIYILQNFLNNQLLDYDDDGVLKTLSNTVNNMFSGWIGTNFSNMTIEFSRDKNIDGISITVCNVSVTFRGLILQTAIICDVAARTE